MRCKIPWALGPLLTLTSFGQDVQKEKVELQARDLTEMYYSPTLTREKKASARTQQKPVSTSKQNHSHPPKDSTESPAYRVGLKYRILLNGTEGQLQEVDPSRTFMSGEKFRLQIESNIDGCLYVLHRGSTGDQTILFPHPEVNAGRIQISRGIQYTVPATDWFIFDEQPGEERVTLVASRTPLEGFPQQVTPEGSHPPVDRLMAGLNGDLLARDIRIFKETSPLKVSQVGSVSLATVVVNTSEEDNDVVFTHFTLAHR